MASSDKVTEHRGEYATTFRLEVYVLSPDDLHRMVQEEAMRLNNMCQLPAMLPDDCKGAKDGTHD